MKNKKNKSVAAVKLKKSLRYEKPSIESRGKIRVVMQSPSTDQSTS